MKILNLIEDDMNLTDEQIDKLNELLKDKSLDLPEFRRTVNKSGSNYTWLRRNIWIRNMNLSDEIQTLLRIK